MHYLLGLDELGVHYHGPYKSANGEVFFWEEFGCPVGHSHGVMSGSEPGELVAKLMKKYHFSYFTGHDHKAQIGYATMWGPGGAYPVAMGTAGALCRTDGPVPSQNAKEKWTAGLIWSDRVGGLASHTLIPLMTDPGGQEAWCRIDGHTVVGNDYKDHLAVRYPDWGFDR